MVSARGSLLLFAIFYCISHITSKYLSKLQVPVGHQLLAEVDGAHHVANLVYSRIVAKLVVSNDRANFRNKLTGWRFG